MIKFHYGRDHLTSSIALKIAQKKIAGIFHPETHEKVTASAKAVAKISKGEQAVYGINTGFGPLCTTRISESDTRTLQENLLKSHAVGLGEPIPY
jgi:histidine ammonia-lyase